MKLKVFFVIFKGFPVAKNCLRPGSALLNKPAAKSFESCRFVKVCMFKYLFLLPGIKGLILRFALYSVAANCNREDY